jgi:photosystem II stability/assembly factor-like uncharacterized protein
MRSKMKNLILLITFISVGLCFAQTWTAQTSGTTIPLFGVYFTDVNNGTAVGDAGTILRTTNGGIDWTSQSSGITTGWLKGVFFTDVNNGTAVGYDNSNHVGAIIRTIDGGTNWTSQTSGTTKPLYDVSFTDPNNGIVVGTESTILRTTNGGTNWTSQTWGTTIRELWSVSFSDANNGTVVGEGGTFLRTTNSGIDWTSQTGFAGTWMSVSFTDVNNGTAVGFTGMIARTTDGGTNWAYQINDTNEDLYSVSFTDANNGTAVGRVGRILRTTNGGTNWTSQTSGTSIELWDVSFTDANNGTAVGEGGTILRTTDGALPVELTSFSASVNSGVIMLKWITATEIKNYGFEIERTLAHSTEWEKIGFVQGNGNSNSPKEYSFADNSATSGKYAYRLKQIDNDGTYEYSNEIKVDLGIPAEFSLQQNYPNPFNPETIISYQIPVSGKVSLRVFDMLGREVATIVNEVQEAGIYDVSFNGKAFASGAYFYRFQSGDFVKINKMILMK